MFIVTFTRRVVILMCVNFCRLKERKLYLMLSTYLVLSNDRKGMKGYCVKVLMTSEFVSILVGDGP